MACEDYELTSISNDPASTFPAVEVPNDEVLDMNTEDGDVGDLFADNVLPIDAFSTNAFPSDAFSAIEANFTETKEAIGSGGAGPSVIDNDGFITSSE